MKQQSDLRPPAHCSLDLGIFRPIYSGSLKGIGILIEDGILDALYKLRQFTMEVKQMENISRSLGFFSSLLLLNSSGSENCFGLRGWSSL